MCTRDTRLRKQEVGSVLHMRSVVASSHDTELRLAPSPVTLTPCSRVELARRSLTDSAIIQRQRTLYETSTITLDFTPLFSGEQTSAMPSIISYASEVTTMRRRTSSSITTITTTNTTTTSSYGRAYGRQHRLRRCRRTSYVALRHTSYFIRRRRHTSYVVVRRRRRRRRRTSSSYVVVRRRRRTSYVVVVIRRRPASRHHKSVESETSAKTTVIPMQRDVLQIITKIYSVLSSRTMHPSEKFHQNSSTILLTHQVTDKQTNVG